MTSKERFYEIYPEKYFLEEGNENELEYFLSNLGKIQAGEKILSNRITGQGNMNFVLRVKTTLRSFILKQARPWVEKYPQIEAPVERSEVEATFYSFIQTKHGLHTFSPSILWGDKKHFLLALEDLGPASDYQYLYEKNQLFSRDDLIRAVQFLKLLHSIPLDTFPANKKMRDLNHEHIFRFPYQEDNGLDLNQIQAGLMELSSPFKRDKKLISEIERLGAVYLDQGRSLIHGDFYPGSWLKTDQGLKVIDPEFAFHGPPEFDLGVMMAHMMMAAQGKETYRQLWEGYAASPSFNTELFSAFAGIEIMRRIIGIAQLPLQLSIVEKINLMSQAREWIMEKNILEYF